jgi:alpha-mannosidase
MRLSLLRAPTQPDPETDMGSHAFSWAVYPHLGTFAESDVPQVSYAFNTPLHRASDANLSFLRAGPWARAESS